MTTVTTTEETTTVVVTPVDGGTVVVQEEDSPDTVVQIIQDSPATIQTTPDPGLSVVTIATPGPMGPAGPAGPQGEEGPQGPQGEPGESGDLSYVHTQIASASTWNITHNLGKMPSVTVVDTGDNVVTGDVIYVDVDNVQILFASAFTGKAYLN